MPDDDYAHPEYVQCSSCGRLIAAIHANTSGRCVYCAGKPKATAEEEPAKPAPAEPRTGDDIPVSTPTASDHPVEDEAE